MSSRTVVERESLAFVRRLLGALEMVFDASGRVEGHSVVRPIGAVTRDEPAELSRPWESVKRKVPISRW